MVGRLRRGLGLRGILVAGATTTVLLSGFTAPAVAAPPVEPGASYLAVGDSLAAGYAAPPGTGYADDLLTHYRQQVAGLTLTNLGCANETTDTMLHGGICPYAQGSQLAAAETFLRAHRGRVTVVTIDIGGNDVVGCGLNGLDLACLQHGLATVGTNLRSILRGLRDAAGPDIPIVGMTYFDPFLVRWLEGPDGQTFARATVPLDDQVSSILSATYKAFGVPVADVEGAFATHDFTHMVSRPYGTVPRNVANVCDWLDMTCSPHGVDFLGVDANQAGYKVIAQAFEAVTPRLIGVSPSPTPSAGAGASTSPDQTGSSTTATSSQPQAQPVLPRTGRNPTAPTAIGLGAILLGIVMVRRSTQRRAACGGHDTDGPRTASGS